MSASKAAPHTFGLKKAHAPERYVSNSLNTAISMEPLVQQQARPLVLLPCVKSTAMEAHIEPLREKYLAGRHAVLIVDGAAWHSHKMNRSNVTLVKLPPYSPELNPIEQVWLWLKQKWLSNRAYKDYDAIVDACCEAWNRFADNQELISRLCRRKWACI